jgi:hypothetical protein
MSLRSRLMGVGNHPEVPSELLDELKNFPHITSKIVALWGTVELHKYLEKLFSDTRGDTREGFPSTAARALLALTNMHTAHLESRGIKLLDFEGTEFVSKSKS